MKKLLFVLLFISGFANAQVVNIPDANFKAKLISLGIDTNIDNEMQESEAILVTTLDVSNSSIVSLQGINSFTNITSLTCKDNQISTIDISSLINLTFFDCQNNQITALNLTGLFGLTEIACGDNLLTALDCGGLVNLTNIDCPNNQITTINLNGLINLRTIFCNNNQLTTLDLNQTPQLIALNCSDNLLSTLDISNLSITELFCENNQLVSLFIKNGINQASNFTFNGNPNLVFICADEDELDYIYNQFTIFDINNCVANSYCSFVPGGSYNTISGTAKFDSDSNGCDESDAFQPNIKLVMTGNPIPNTTFTKNDGTYNFYTNAGNYDLAPVIENETAFTVNPASANVVFADNNNNVTNQDFCISASGIFPDVEAVVGPLNQAVLGSMAKYILVYKNKGNQIATGTVNLSFDDNQLDYFNSSILPSANNTGSLTWDFSNLQPFESRSIEINFQLTNSLDIGSLIQVSTSINTTQTDQLPEDNQLPFNQNVVVSQQPFSITCIEGQEVSSASIGDYLHYIINFDNTGTVTANNVVVRLDIDTTLFDVDSLQILNTSHNTYTRQTGNRVEIIFPQCDVLSGGHGTVMLKIKTQTTEVLQPNNMVTNTAKIFFDYNAPNETNVANTLFSDLANPNVIEDVIINIFPNPSHSIININSKNTIHTIEVYDIQGRLLEANLVDKNAATLNIIQRAKGIYFVKVTTDLGIKIQKIIKD